MRRILYSTLIVGAFSMAAAGAYAQEQDPPRQQPGANAARNLRARVP